MTVSTNIETGVCRGRRLLISAMLAGPLATAVTTSVMADDGEPTPTALALAEHARLLENILALERLSSRFWYLQTQVLIAAAAGSSPGGSKVEPAQLAPLLTTTSALRKEIIAIQRVAKAYKSIAPLRKVQLTSVGGLLTHIPDATFEIAKYLEKGEVTEAINLHQAQPTKLYENMQVALDKLVIGVREDIDKLAARL